MTENHTFIIANYGILSTAEIAQKYGILSTAEIAQKTGYTERSVRAVASLLRKQGHPVKKLSRGRRKKVGGNSADLKGEAAA
jgi:hypothetical protein